MKIDRIVLDFQIVQEKNRLLPIIAMMIESNNEMYTIQDFLNDNNDEKTKDIIVTLYEVCKKVCKNEIFLVCENINDTDIPSFITHKDMASEIEAYTLVEQLGSMSFMLSKLYYEIFGINVGITIANTSKLKDITTICVNGEEISYSNKMMTDINIENFAMLIAKRLEGVLNHIIKTNRKVKRLMQRKGEI